MLEADGGTRLCRVATLSPSHATLAGEAALDLRSGSTCRLHLPRNGAVAARGEAAGLALSPTPEQYRNLIVEPYSTPRDAIARTARFGPALGGLIRRSFGLREGMRRS